jgi:hypothetical protein
MSLVDPSGLNDPNSPSPGTAGADEYTVSAQQIIFQSYKAGAGTILAPNTAGKLVYIVRKPTAGGGGVADNGTVIAALSPGQTFILGSSAMTKNVFNPYRYFIDADTGTDGCQVTLIIQ